MRPPGARAGILIRSAEALESAHRLDTIVLDKTGTITAGKPALTDVHTVAGFTEDELLGLVAGAEADSEHPLATAIAAGAQRRSLTPPPATGFDSITGKGIQATVDGHAVLVGTARLLADVGIDTTALDEVAGGLSAQGKTPILAAIDGRAAGVLAVADDSTGEFLNWLVLCRWTVAVGCQGRMCPLGCSPSRQEDST